jgi:hypothetical protein
LADYGGNITIAFNEYAVVGTGNDGTRGSSLESLNYSS